MANCSFTLLAASVLIMVAATTAAPPKKPLIQPDIMIPKDFGQSSSHRTVARVRPLINVPADYEQTHRMADGRRHHTKRSLQPGAPNFPAPGGQQQNGGWQVNPSIGGDGGGNTRAEVGVKHTGPRHEVEASVSKVVRGPQKAQPSWNVRGTFNG